MRLAAIDIGSNAIRLIIYDILTGRKSPVFKRTAAYRIPIRLGEDAFTLGYISEEKARQLMESMNAFQHLIRVFNPEKVLAAATSAMRDAKNGADLSKKIRKECKLPLEIISGEDEAKFIFANHFENELNPKENYLYIDVGGGSTELTLIQNGERLHSESFNLGTVRILNKMDKKSEWRRLSKWIEENTRALKKLTAIGSGGNINRIYKLSKANRDYQLSLEQVKDVMRLLSPLSYEERMIKLKLKADRADVIIPATDLYIFIMKKAKILNIYIPQFGLADGMIRQAYEEKLG